MCHNANTRCKSYIDAGYNKIFILLYSDFVNLLLIFNYILGLSRLNKWHLSTAQGYWYETDMWSGGDTRVVLSCFVLFCFFFVALCFPNMLTLE